ncbi:hypothetical protein MNBD_GAMMA21-1698 [hydrothermal vent metagenome]|uniref:Uncharacterized protein n=1 Tax=hydrothermal vent metagenome TaxID=652676 RepID=A0A3B0ZVM3_9ZZZZ
MKLLRNILSHGLLIVFIAALALVYVYRAQLFPENITSKVDYYVDEALTWIGVFPGEKQLAQDTVDEVVEEQPVSTTKDVLALEQTSDADEKNTAMHMMEETSESQEEREEQPPVQSQMMPVPENDEENVVEDTKPEIHAMEQEKSDEVEGAATDQLAAGTAQDELLNRARLAFQNGKPDKSTQLYKELSELNPDNPDIYGEMGNVFYSQGKWKQAGVAFYEAAICLLDKNKTEQVPYLYRVIQGLDPESAEKLRSKLH